ncbi:hypothetical protein TIFTF001_012952 [Ficus carica]|uniref:Uncharacterized protein n=1 Tax=Ficus carica TaxID=3494 RepID=A0AA88AP32_FICCA|nr:hypothetical protein TIFTF001_012952 [Ficus carica]
MDDSQWDALRLLANVLVSAWESETEKTKNNSPLFLEEPKVRKLIFKLCKKKGQRERFVIGNGEFSNFRVIGKKKTTVGKKRQRLDNLYGWPYSFPLSSSPSSSPTTFAKKKRKISRIFETPEPSKMPANLKNRIVEIDGEEFTFVLQKELSSTDVNRNNNRLSVPERLRARAEFLEEEEKTPKAPNPESLILSSLRLSVSALVTRRGRLVALGAQLHTTPLKTSPLTAQPGPLHFTPPLPVPPFTSSISLSLFS